MSGALIQKSEGVTGTENLLARLCERTFLKLWSYPNPFKEGKGEELCDLLAVFDNHAFVFFDRNSSRLDCDDDKFPVQWARWKRKVIDNQIKTARQAEAYLRSGKPVFLDARNTQEFPLNLGPDMIIHKIIVAHGAADACRNFSENNISGSLAVFYGSEHPGFEFPFAIELSRDERIHVFDSENLEIIFGELDTFADFLAYVVEKERAIARYDPLVYCGEEDLLAAYFVGWNEKEQRYSLDPQGRAVDGMCFDQGGWESFRKSEPYARRKQANEASGLWDYMIQKTCQNALDGTVRGDADLLRGRSAIHEMAREPRLFRRVISERMIGAIRTFPEREGAMLRHVSYGPSFTEGKAYVFLQLYVDPKVRGDYETFYRPRRQKMLEVACGAARVKFPHLKTVVGIAMDAPKLHQKNSEDFALLDCSNWTPEMEAYFEAENEVQGFFQSPSLRVTKLHVSEFPAPESKPALKLTGRNQPCPCGSGQKFKKCCGR